MSELEFATIEGACHCRNIRYTLKWPGPVEDLPARRCGCTFCQKHGGSWTSHRDAELNATVSDSSTVSKYKFGTKTATFYVCSICGAAPFVVSEIEGQLYAVVNVNTFDGIDASSLSSSPTNFDGEDTGSRLDRRKKNWIPRVKVS